MRYDNVVTQFFIQPTTWPRSREQQRRSVVSLSKKIMVAVVAACVSSVVVAETSLAGNVGPISNYVWRGVTQNNDSAAVQGGVDYTAGGAYAGVWNSSLAGGDYETDLYAGYKNDPEGARLFVTYKKSLSLKFCLIQKAGGAAACLSLPPSSRHGPNYWVGAFFLHATKRLITVCGD
jgi:hypothetical protein